MPPITDNRNAIACDLLVKANIVLGRAASTEFTTYAEYLALFDRAWNGASGQEIKHHMTSGSVRTESAVLPLRPADSGVGQARAHVFVAVSWILRL